MSSPLAPRPKLLLTGFEPFGEWKRNATAEATAALDGQARGEVVLRAITLPVAYPRAAEVVARAIQAERPLAVLAFGIHGDPTGAFRVEEVAANSLDFPIPDNDGSLRKGEPIARGGPTTLEATLPVGELEAAIRARSLAVVRSRDAGRYLCNAVYYSLLASGARAAFVHVPPRLPGERADDVFSAVEAAATAAARIVTASRVLS